MNPGTNGQDLTPISLERGATTVLKRKIPPPRSSSSFTSLQVQGRPEVTDKGVSRTTYQRSAVQARPAQGPGSGMRTNTSGNAGATQPPPSAGTPGTAAPAPVTRPRQERPPAASPSNILDSEIADESRFSINSSSGGRAMNQTEAAELAGVLVPPSTCKTDTEAYGYPKGSRVYKINMQQAWLLAIMNARFYQYNLEQVYLAAIPGHPAAVCFRSAVLCRHEPGHRTDHAGGHGWGRASFPSTPGVSTANTFTYATRFSPNGQISTLNMGTVAGVGKLFSTGGQLVMGFANEVLFNFVGKNPQQPTVISALPISFVQPLLRGGGRAVTLEPLTTAERTALCGPHVCLFRQQFFVVTLTGGTIQNFGSTFNLAGFNAPGTPTRPSVPAGRL